MINPIDYIRSVYRNLGKDTKLKKLPQDGISVHTSMIEYFTRFRDDILQHAKPTCFEELTVFHLLSFMGKKGYEDGLGVMSFEERTASYENGLGAMSAEERMTESKKGYVNILGGMLAEDRTASYENGIGTMSAKDRAAAGKNGYENGLGAMSAKARTAASATILSVTAITWENKYDEFKRCMEMSERGIPLHN